MGRDLFNLPIPSPVNPNLPIYDPLRRLLITLDHENSAQGGGESVDKVSSSGPSQDLERVLQGATRSSLTAAELDSIKFSHFSDFLGGLRELTPDVAQKIKQSSKISLVLNTHDASQRFEAEFHKVVPPLFRLLFQRLEIKEDREVALGYWKEEKNKKVVFHWKEGQLSFSGDVPEERRRATGTAIPVVTSVERRLTPSPLPAVTAEAPSTESPFKRAVELLRNSSDKK